VLHLTELHYRKSLPGLPATAVFGADGYIGSNILAGLRRANPDCVGVGRRPSAGSTGFDLADPDIAPLGLKSRGITHAVIAAGITQLSLCEQNPAATRAVNVHGVTELSRQLSIEGIRVVTFSSDYVFDGIDGSYLENSPVNPLNEYGRQKVELESRLLGSGDRDILVIRLSKVFDVCWGSGTLLDEIASRLLRGIPVQAATDQYFCPVLIDDVVMAVLYLLVSEKAGIVHLCAPARTSRLDLAFKVADVFGCSRELVQRISLNDLDDKLCRPLDTTMVCTHIDQMPPGCFTSLDSCIARLQSNYVNRG